jgi:capsular polysaccharide biosynthesis protein
MNIFYLFKEILIRWKLILAAALFGAICIYAYFKFNPPMYSSTVTFYLENSSAQSTQEIKFNDNDLVFIKSVDADRLFNMTKSSKMTKHLIEKFDLYTHYGINKKKDFYIEKATAQLLSNISVTQTLHSSISVKVQDYDKLMAANIANEIFFFLNKMNQDILVGNIEKKFKIYEQVLQNMRSQTNSQVQQLKEVLEKCNTLYNTGVANGKNAEFVVELQVKLVQLTNRLSVTNSDIQKAVEIYGISVESIQKENLPTLSLINQALPEFESNRRNLAMYMLVGSIVAAWAAATIIGLYIQHLTDLKSSKEK